MRKVNDSCDPDYKIKKKKKNRRKAEPFKKSRQKHRRVDLKISKGELVHTGPKRGYAHLMHCHRDTKSACAFGVLTLSRPEEPG